MGCKTQAEWEKIGSIQCGVRVTANVDYHHITKVLNEIVIKLYYHGLMFEFLIFISRLDTTVLMIGTNQNIPLCRLKLAAVQMNQPSLVCMNPVIFH